MVVRCLTGARMNMRATILRPLDDYQPELDDIEKYGTWKKSQDPLTKEIVNVFEPYQDTSTPSVPGQEKYRTIPCLARGVVSGGINGAGTSEDFGATYMNIDYVHMWVPGNVKIDKRDRVTNICDASGRIRWRDEENESDGADPLDLTDETNIRATVFNVSGVTPLFDPFNRMTSQFVLLERAQV